MNLPLKISPNPLLTSAVEIRFSSKIKRENVLTTFFPLLAANFPQIVANPIPLEIRDKNEQFKYAADFILSNDKYAVSIGNNVISFECKDDYYLWSNYFPVIKDTLNRLAICDFTAIERVAIRYASLFDGKTSIETCLAVKGGLDYPIAKEELKLYRTDLKVGNINLHLQIANQAKAQKADKKIEGLYIDIDAYVIDELPSAINEDLIKLIDKLHGEEKKLFFSLLKDDFLTTLNPEY